MKEAKGGESPNLMHEMDQFMAQIEEDMKRAREKDNNISQKYNKLTRKTIVLDIAPISLKEERYSETRMAQARMTQKGTSFMAMFENPQKTHASVVVTLKIKNDQTGEEKLVNRAAQSVMIPVNLGDADDLHCMYTALGNMQQQSGEHITELGAEIIYLSKKQLLQHRMGSVRLISKLCEDKINNGHYVEQKDAQHL